MTEFNTVEVRETLRAAETRYDQTVIRNSPQEMLLFYQEMTTPDFVERDNPAGNVTTREQMLEMLEQVVATGRGFDHKELIHVGTAISELTISGDTATAVIVHSMHYIQTDTHGWYGSEGADVEIKNADRWERVWKHTTDGWRLQSSRYVGPA